MRVRGLGLVGALLVGLSSLSVVVLAGRPTFSFLPAAADSTSGGLTATRTAATRVAPALDNQNHLYVLDGWGGVHPVGKSRPLSTTASWPYRDIAFSLALFPDGTGGYVMDGWGKLHPVGTARKVDSGVYWPGWIGAREIVMAPWATSARPAGYLLDADGRIHPFGGAPTVSGNSTWPGAGIARGIVLTSNSSPLHFMGYTLDGYGGIHPFGGAPAVSGNTTWPGVDKVRGLVLNPAPTSTTVQGYTLDFSGGIHPFGGAPAVRVSAQWPGLDVADSIIAWSGARPSSPGGWVLDRQGFVHPYGSAPDLAPSKTWPGWDIARGLAGAGSGGGSTENLLLQPEPDANGWGSYFNQRDLRWAGDAVGNSGSTVWRIGCLLSDLAMVYTHFGYSSVTPATIAAHTTWFDGYGDLYNSALNIPGHTTVIVHDPTAAWISAQVRAGHPVIVGMKMPLGSTHFVTLTGMDGANDYWTSDPWDQNAMHVTFSGSWTHRGPIYEAIAFS